VVESFRTENGYDKLTVGGKRYSGNDGPVGVNMKGGDVMTWRADGSVNRKGWKICGKPLDPAKLAAEKAAAIALCMNNEATTPWDRPGGGAWRPKCAMFEGLFKPSHPHYNSRMELCCSSSYGNGVKTPYELCRKSCQSCGDYTCYRDSANKYVPSPYKKHMPQSYFKIEMSAAEEPLGQFMEEEQEHGARAATIASVSAVLAVAAVVAGVVALRRRGKKKQAIADGMQLQPANSEALLAAEN